MVLFTKKVSICTKNEANLGGEIVQNCFDSRISTTRKGGERMLKYS